MFLLDLMSQTSGAVIIFLVLRGPILSPQASFNTVQANRAYRAGLITTDLLALQSAIILHEYCSETWAEFRVYAWGGDRSL